MAAITAALLTLALAESGARWLMSRDPVPHSYDVPRNPRFRRDWVRYTETRPRPDDSRLIIAVANSQGFLREEADGELAWPNRLGTLLNGGGERVLMANWSVPGGNSAEMTLLVARAAAHRPDAVIVSAGANTFVSPQSSRRPLSYWASDATALAYLPPVRRLLPARFLRRTQAHNPVAALQAWSGISWIRARHFQPAPDTWDWIRSIGPPRRVERLPVSVVSSRVAKNQLQDLAAALHRGSPQTRLLIVQMPIARSALSGAARRRAGATARLANELFANEPRIRVANALDLVPPKRFLSAAHMDRRGHAQYARWLEPHVRRLLEREPN